MTRFISTQSSTRLLSLAIAVMLAAHAHANEPTQINRAHTSNAAQTFKPPSTPRVGDALTAPAATSALKAPALPAPQVQPPATPLRPPPGNPAPPALNESAKLTTAAPNLIGNSISGLGDGARGIVAGEALSIRGRGFGANAGRVEISVQTSSNSAVQLPFRVAQWTETEIQGSVGASSGIGDGKAAISIYPAGKSVSEAIHSSQSGLGGATHQGWRFRFTASRAEQTLAMNGLGNALTSSYPNPAPQLIPDGSGLIKGLAVARRYQAATMGCTEPSPSDRYKVALANGFELIRVAATDLNANKRHGLAKPDACDVRGLSSTAEFLRVGANGGFMVSPSWDVINRYGPRSKISACDSSRFIAASKTPLGFDWDNTPLDRCAANAEYVIDHLVVRGPAGVNPLTGAPTNGAIIK